MHTTKNRQMSWHKTLIVTLLLVFSQASSASISSLIITGVYDGPLTGGIPKGVELYVVLDIADLSQYGLGSANNGGGTDGEEFTFPAVAVPAGSCIYVASEATGFNTFFGFDPDYTTGAMGINGDDAVELFYFGGVADVFGDINADGTGQPWDHVDGWAYRNAMTGPDGSTFVLANWSFSGTNALDGETSNATATTPFPIGTYSPCLVVDGPPTVDSSNPVSGATDVPVDAVVSITFSEDVTAVEGDFSIDCSASGSVAFTLGGGPGTFVLTPLASFASGEVCNVTVAGSVADQDGDPDQIGADFTFSFTVAEGVIELPDIVINEIIQNPSAVSDTDGEWFELFNTTDAPIDIDGWTIKDDGSNSHVINNGGPLNVPASGFLVLGRNADPGANGGVTIDYVYSDFFLGNGDDEVVLLDGSQSEVDRVNYDNGSTFPDPNGASMSLVSPVLDNNVGGNWCTASTIFGDGDLGTPGAANDCINMVINEIIQNPSAVSDTNGEWFELFNPTEIALDIDGWTVKDNGTNSFVVDNGGPLIVPAGGFLVLGSDANSGTNGGVTVDYEYSNFFLSNGDDEVILLDLTLTEIDRVEYDGGPNFPDPTGASMSLIVPGLDNNVGANWCTSTTAFGDGDLGTPGEANVCPPVEIFDIQGSGDASPFAGFSATTTNNTVTALGTDGFFMQTPDNRSDNDPNTSDGIFVFTGGAPGVAVGDQVDVDGPVVEFFGFTEFSLPSVTTSAGGDPAGGTVTPVEFNASVPSPNPAAPSCAIEYECYEGMLINIAAGVVTGGNQSFGGDPIAEAYIVAKPTRTYTESGTLFPGLGAPIPTWDGNPEVFEIDPDKLGLPNEALPAGSTFSGTGVLGFEFSGYEFWPRSLTTSPANPVVAVRPAVQGEMTVGALNMFVLDVGAGDLANRAAKLSNYIRNVMRSPDIIAVSEVFSLTELGAVAAQITADDPGVVYTPFLVDHNNVGFGIDVGFLIGADVAVDSIVQQGLGELHTFDNTPLHDRPPLLLEGRYTGNGLDFPFAVVAVHNRSLGSITDPIEGPRVRNKRLEQAQSIAAKAQAYQTANPDTPYIIIGDFNAFQFTDGLVDVIGQISGNIDPAMNLVSGPDLVDPNLTNQVDGLPPLDQYSFVFQGNAGMLDHVLTSSAANAYARGMAVGRGNADEAIDRINDIGTANRSSDHDGIVFYMMTDFDGDGFPDDMDLCPFGAGSSADSFNNDSLVDGCTVPIPATDFRGLMILALLLMTLGSVAIRRTAI